MREKETLSLKKKENKEEILDMKVSQSLYVDDFWFQNQMNDSKHIIKS